MEKQTIIQVLANEFSNHKWVRQAIINTLNSDLGRADMKLRESTESDLKQAMNWGFMWHQTPEGHEYWEEIHNALK